jgi:dipeptidyl aminopeptidase
MNNDLYVTDLKKHTRVTFDGAATIFNGVPDWVYEEEVFGNNFATWWSPDATHVAYLRFNETEVPEYRLPLFAKSNESYPQEIAIKYPKVSSVVTMYCYLAICPKMCLHNFRPVIQTLLCLCTYIQ